MKKLLFLCGALFFLWMSLFLGTDAQSHDIRLCQYNGAAQSGARLPAQLGGSVNVTFCVTSSDYYFLNYTRLLRPGQSKDSLIRPTVSETGPSQWLLTITVSDIRQLDFTDKFVVKVFFRENSYPNEAAYLVSTFSLYEENEAAKDLWDYSNEEDDDDDDGDDDADDKSSKMTCTDTETTSDGNCDSGWKYAQGKCVKLFDKEPFGRAVEMCGENDGHIVGDLDSLTQCFGGDVSNDVKAVWKGRQDGMKCTVLKQTNERRNIRCENKRLFLCGKNPKIQLPKARPQTMKLPSLMSTTAQKRVTPTAPKTTPTTTPTTTTTTPTTTSTTATTTTKAAATTTTTMTPKPLCPSENSTQCPEGWKAHGQGQCLKLGDKESEYGHIAQRNCEDMGANLLDGTEDASTTACILELMSPHWNSYIWISACRQLDLRTGWIFPYYIGDEPNMCKQSYPAPYVCAMDKNKRITTTTTQTPDKDISDNSGQEVTTSSILSVLATLVVILAVLGLYFYCRLRRLGSHPRTSRTSPTQRDGGHTQETTKQKSNTDSGDDRSHNVYQNTSGLVMMPSQFKDGQHISETTQVPSTEYGNGYLLLNQNTNDESFYEPVNESVYEQADELIYEQVNELVSETIV